MISIGIDAAKGKSTVCILKPYGEVVVPPRDIMHKASELESLIFLLKSLGEPVKAVMESTGTYHYPMLHVLVRAGIFVAEENPLVIKKYISASIRKGKTDKMDAIKLAQYGLEKWLTLRKYEPQEATYNKLKLLGRQYTNYIEMRVAALISFRIYWIRQCPESLICLNQAAQIKQNARLATLRKPSGTLI